MRTRIVLLLLSWLAAQTAGASTTTPPVDPELRAELKQAIASADSFHDRFDAEVWLLDMSTRMTPYIRDEQQRHIPSAGLCGVLRGHPCQRRPQGREHLAVPGTCHSHSDHRGDDDGQPIEFHRARPPNCRPIRRLC